MKISNKVEYIENQYLLLSKLQELKKITPDTHPCIEQEKIEEATIISLLLCHANFQKDDTYVKFRDILYPKDKLKKFSFLSDIVDNLPEDKTQNSIIEITTVETNEHIQNKINNINESAINAESTKESINTNNTEEVINSNFNNDDLVFGLYNKENNNLNHHETENKKYFDTMWFNIFHIVCNIKDGFAQEKFNLVVFPTEIRPDRRPVPQAVALLYGNSVRYMFSEIQGRASITINCEEFTFDVTSRFVDGNLNTKVTVASKNYDLSDIEEENYKGILIPNNFGKRIDFGNENIIIYPISLSNNIQSGCVPFIYRQESNGKVTTGVSEDDDGILIVTEKGGAKHITCYWKEQDADRSLMVIID